MEPPAESRGRLLSLDIFRGATIASMMLVNNAGDWEHTYAPLLHAKWNGWTFTDTVFPFFLWIVGVSMTFSFAKRVERGDDRARLLLHILRRAALIILIGLALNATGSRPLSDLRIPGVLQRIGLCYLLGAAIFLWSSWKGQIAWIVGLLASYWMMMTLVPVPGFGPGVLTPEGNFAAWVDAQVLGDHVYSATKPWDPEGIVSTLPSIATLLFGALAGHLLRTRLTLPEKAAWLFSAGTLATGLATLLDRAMPINKMIWTSTYSLFMAGLAALTFGVWFWLVDGCGWRRGTEWLRIYGMNAIAVYVAAGLLARLGGRFKVTDVLVDQGFTQWLGDPYLGSLLYAVLFVFVLYGIAWGLHRRGWYIRL